MGCSTHVDIIEYIYIKQIDKVSFQVRQAKEKDFSIVKQESPILYTGKRISNQVAIEKSSRQY